jgi:dTDP-4-dehydrorhamnose 3,5-epimerase
MKIVKNILNDCLLLEPVSFIDSRGSFTKFFSKTAFSELDLTLDIQEQFYTFSKKNVIRGMHFQAPPFDHDKLATCINGRVLDVVLDLRKESSNYGKVDSCILDSTKESLIYIPKGFAHGFLSLEDDSCVMYSVTTQYEPDNDKGILWSSFGFDWPCDKPIISKRDLGHIAFKDYSTPF